MEAIRTYEMSVHTRSTWRYIPEDVILRYIFNLHEWVFTAVRCRMGCGNMSDNENMTCHYPNGMVGGMLLQQILEIQFVRF
jgi:hypothetical protein